jgi:hypothetical protein
MSDERDTYTLENDLRLYELGRELRPLVNSPSWEIFTDTIQSYVDDLDQQHRRLPPGDPNIIASHAALYALDQFATKFKADIERAVDFANAPSQEVLEYAHEVRKANDVLAAQRTN